MEDIKVIALRESVFEDNNADAAKLRRELSDKGTFLINLMSAPGSGKTSTLRALLPLLTKELSVAVMEVPWEEASRFGLMVADENDKITEFQETLMPMIPAVIFVNDGLTGEDGGESEIEILQDDESWYSKLSCADIDSQRKSMNPTKYTVDMESNSTKNLSTAAGAFWDLGSDQNLDKPNPQVGLLEPAMNYSAALDMTLKRVKKAAYEQVDMPDIETVQATITSGKALKAIYWPLIIRCKEKMKMWGPQLRALVNIIIQGAMVYPNCVDKYINDVVTPVAYEVTVVGNTPLPEDEIEEKNMDLAEVESKVMSRKAYMKKWRGLTDDEVDEEIQQIALERQMIEDSAFASNNFGGNSGNGPETPEEVDFSEEDSDLMQK